MENHRSLKIEPVSIQPKPKNGLEELPVAGGLVKLMVSIQPKPKNGLEGIEESIVDVRWESFNPAEAEEWFRRINTMSFNLTLYLFQSSRSRRMV